MQSMVGKNPVLLKLCSLNTFTTRQFAAAPTSGNLPLFMIFMLSVKVSLVKSLPNAVQMVSEM